MDEVPLVESPLGDALTPSALLVTLSSLLAWTAAWRCRHALDSCITALLCLAPPSLAAGDEPGQLVPGWADARAAIWPRLLFSSAAVVVGAVGLLLPAPGPVADPAYGHSPMCQFTYAIAGGFHLWEACTALSTRRRVATLGDKDEAEKDWWPLAPALAPARWSNCNAAHSAFCLVLYVCAQFPFYQRAACWLLILEVTELLQSLLVLVVLQTPDWRRFALAQRLYTFAFAVFRVILPLPLAAFWLTEAIALISDATRDVLNPTGCALVAMLIVPVLALNCYRLVLLAIQAWQMHQAQKLENAAMREMLAAEKAAKTD